MLRTYKPCAVILLTQNYKLYLMHNWFKMPHKRICDKLHGRSQRAGIVANKETTLKSGDSLFKMGILFPPEGANSYL